MTEIVATLQVIALALFLLLLFKDMSGQDQLRGIIVCVLGVQCWGCYMETFSQLWSA